MTQTLKMTRANVQQTQPNNTLAQKLLQLVERKKEQAKSQVSNTNKRHPKSVAPLY